MALTDKGEAKLKANSFAESDGSTGVDVTGADSACNSFWEGEEGVAGAKGALL